MIRATEDRPVTTYIAGSGSHEFEFIDTCRVRPSPHSHSPPGSADAGIAAQRLRAAGYDVTTGVGQTGIVGVLREDEGATIMLRADVDALLRARSVLQAGTKENVIPDVTVRRSSIRRWRLAWRH